MKIIGSRRSKHKYKTVVRERKESEDLFISKLFFFFFFFFFFVFVIIIFKKKLTLMLYSSQGNQRCQFDFLRLFNNKQHDGLVVIAFNHSVA